jgi:hypothetical protein
MGFMDREYMRRSRNGSEWHKYLWTAAIVVGLTTLARQIIAGRPY